MPPSAAIQKAAEVIDMTAQQGVHPRIGATDVCPLIPLAGMTMAEADYYAQQLGQRVGEELGIPVYLYEHSQLLPYRQALPDIRKGQYEGFAEKITQPEWAPDFGPLIFTPASGATVIGARNILVAFNISLNTRDVTIAEAIAKQLRTRGFTLNEGGNKKKVPGLLPKTRAIGWYMTDYQQAQVSINLLDYRITSPLKAFDACKELAEKLGATVTGSEVIGLIPEACLLEAGTKANGNQHDTTALVAAGIRYLGLDNLKPFPPAQKVLEYALQAAGLTFTAINE